MTFRMSPARLLFRCGHLKVVEGALPLSVKRICFGYRASLRRAALFFSLSYLPPFLLHIVVLIHHLFFFTSSASFPIDHHFLHSFSRWRPFLIDNSSSRVRSVVAFSDHIRFKSLPLGRVSSGKISCVLSGHISSVLTSVASLGGISRTLRFLVELIKLTKNAT
jgi:hypothetical protein